MEEHKEQKAEEFSDRYPMCEYKVSVESFKAGWDAALDYFSNLPYDKMMEAFDEHFKSKEDTK